MMKALARGEDGTATVVIGLSFGNIKRLKQDSPILFNLSELGLSPQSVCIAWKRDDGRVGLPKDFDGIAMCFTGETLDKMRQAFLELDAGEYHFSVFVAKSEVEMEKMMRPLCDARTNVTRTGFPPGLLPPWGN